MEMTEVMGMDFDFDLCFVRSEYENPYLHNPYLCNAICGMIRFYVRDEVSFSLMQKAMRERAGELGLVPMCTGSSGKDNLP